LFLRGAASMLSLKHKAIYNIPYSSGNEKVWFGELFSQRTFAIHSAT
jgi:hypothetical protein